MGYPIPSYQTIARNSKMFSSVVRPQANGQVEAVNKVIKHNLETKLEDLKGRWIDKLPELLWVYKTTARSTTRETPFSLAYGYEAMVQMEIGARSLTRDNYDPEQNMILQQCELDYLKEKRCDSQLRIAMYQRRTARYFNSKMKTRRFWVGNLVLKKSFTQ